jgi:predicted ATP-binding protein involved in virulence
MRIDHLHLENFKKFAVQDIDLHPNFTLLVGENGAGKTSLLDALAVASAIWLAEPPDSELQGSGRNILKSEIRLQRKKIGDRLQFVEEKPVIVRAKGTIADRNDIEWTRKIKEDGVKTTNKDAQKALRAIGAIYWLEKDKNRLCPVLAYYGAGRAWLPSNQRVPKGKTNGPAKRWAAFYDCFNERIRFAELNQWFSRETTERGNRQGRWRPGFEVVRRAILRCIPDADDVWFDTDMDGIVLSIAGNAQPFDNLSAGQRMMLALVADLAIKCVTQNAYLIPPDDLGPEDEPLPRVLQKTPGVVLIDEVDVHLHPSWQRRIAKDLMEAFPAIQFVCTTHSPQVIGELDKQHIRVIGDDGSVSIPSASYGLDSSRVLEEVMHTSERTDAEVERLRELALALDQEDFAQAKKLIGEVEAKLGANDPEVTRARTLMTFLQDTK